MAKTWVDFYNTLMANAQNISAARASDPSMQIKWNYTGDKSAVDGSGKSGKSAGDRLWNDDMSVGKRILDVMSRGTYTSANITKKTGWAGLYEAANPLAGAVANLTGHGPDVTDVASAAWGGLSGHDKTTYQDVLKDEGMGEGFHLGPISGRGLAGFGLDVVLDPTTYIGPGAIKAAFKGGKGAVEALTGAGKAARATGQAGKITESAVKDPVARAAEAVAAGKEVAVPTKRVDDFIKNINRNAETPGSGVFDTVVSTARETGREPLGRVLPEDSRVFVGDAAGNMDERLMLPGPGADIIGGRARMADLEEMAKGIPQFKYGSFIKDVPDSGFWKEIVEKVPNEVEGVPQVMPKAIVEGRAAKEAAKNYSDLPVIGPEVKDPLNRAILNDVGAKVADEYEKVAYKTEGGQTKYYHRPVEGAYQTTMGELRRILSDPATNPNKRAMAKQMLQGHVKAIKDYAASVPEGYKSTEQFLKDYYGLGAVSDSARAQKAALDAAEKAKGPSDIPDGPFTAAAKAMPKFREVKRFERMNPVEKAMFMHTKLAGLSEADMVYLAQASNPKSFQTRLYNLAEGERSVRATNGVDDLIDAIKDGRIEVMDEPGLPELMQKIGAKSLEDVVSILEKERGRLSEAEKNLIGKVVGEANMGVKVSEGGVKELGPTGNPYRGFNSEVIAKANERIATKVKPAEQILQEVKAGDKSGITRVKQTLNVNQTKMFDEALKLAVEKNVIDPKVNKELWHSITKTGALRTSKVVNEGKGRYRDAWGSYPQYDFFKSLMNNADKIDPQIKNVLNEAGVRGADRLYARASTMYDTMMPALKAMDDVLKEGGVFPVAGHMKTDVPFSLFEAMHVLEPDFVKRTIFTLDKTKNSIIAPTTLMDIMKYAVLRAKEKPLSQADAEVIADMLMETRKTRAGNVIPNGLKTYISKIKDEGTRLERLHSQFVDPIMEAIPDLLARVNANEVQRKLWHENKIAKAKDTSLDELAAQITDPFNSPGDLAKFAAKPEIVVGKVTRHQGLDADDAWAVTQEVRATQAELGLTPELAAVGKNAEQMANASTKSSKIKVGAKIMDEAEEESAKIAEEIGVPLSDLGTRIEQSFTYRMLRYMAPHVGNEDVRYLFLERKSVTQNLARGYQALLSGINKAHTKQSILAAWKELQNGTISTVPEIKAAQDDLSKAVNTLFSKDENYNVFARNNINATDVNTHFAHFQIHEKYRFTNDMNNDWKTWDTDNPLDLLGKVQAATMSAMTKRMLGDSLVQKFGSSVPKEGHVKISTRGSVLAHYLDLEQYYPKDVAGQFHILDKFIKESMEPSKYRPVLNLMDNVLHSYKAGMTIYRPGHHIRNMVGDIWLSHMAGVNNPLVYKKALKIMAQNHGRYQDFDAIKAFMANQPATPTAGKFVDDGSIVLTAKIKGGKRISMTGGEIYRAAYDAGILNDYRTLEDIQMGAESFSGKLANAKLNPFKGRLQRAAASFSEARDHYIRLAHFIDVLQKGNYRTLEEGITQAGRIVKKWHPDGSDLTHFESKVMRRTFLFYSWIRKAIPLVAESLVLRPGKVMLYPKFMYNMAEGNGIDLDSMTDPFPTDQLFPDWIKDSMTGPFMQDDTGHYWSANPGVPAMDVLNDYGGSQAGRSIAGSLNPLLKIPMETVQGIGNPAVAVDNRTGVKNYDLSDYVDRQVPGLGYAANITGRSPSQLFMEPKGGADREAQPNAMAFYNMLSGMGLTDISKPSYQRQAVKDAKARARKQAGG